MPPNGQSVHGGGGLVAPVAAPAPSSKMDCFLTSVCTPLNLQVRTHGATCMADLHARARFEL